jgi:hypothetical protein
MSYLQEILEEALPAYNVNLTQEQLKELAEGISISLDCSSMVSHYGTGGTPSRIDWESKYKALEREFKELKSNTDERLRDYSWAMKDRDDSIRSFKRMVETCQSRGN